MAGVRKSEVVSIVPERLHAARAALRLSLAELARMSGLSAPSISLAERGRQRLSYGSLGRVAGAFAEAGNAEPVAVVAWLLGECDELVFKPIIDGLSEVVTLGQIP